MSVVSVSMAVLMAGIAAGIGIRARRGSHLSLIEESVVRMDGRRGLVGDWSGIEQEYEHDEMCRYIRGTV